MKLAHLRICTFYAGVWTLFNTESWMGNHGDIVEMETWKTIFCL
jgi:hypothetical protein